MNPNTVEDDEIPSPPAPGEHSGAGEAEASFDSNIDASLFGDVPKKGEAIPVGTYKFRLDSYKKMATASGKNIGQPYFQLQWKCQEEPYTGRVVFENVPWVSAADVKDANDPTSPRRGEAKKTLNNRLPSAKEVMEAADFKPSGKFGFEEFLAGHPEMKLQLKLKEKQSKTGKSNADGSAEYKGTGEMGNEVQKHLSLVRPA